MTLRLTSHWEKEKNRYRNCLSVIKLIGWLIWFPSQNNNLCVFLAYAASPWPSTLGSATSSLRSQADGAATISKFTSDHAEDRSALEGLKPVITCPHPERTCLKLSAWWQYQVPSVRPRDVAHQPQWRQEVVCCQLRVKSQEYSVNTSDYCPKHQPVVSCWNTTRVAFAFVSGAILHYFAIVFEWIIK